MVAFVSEMAKGRKLNHKEFRIKALLEISGSVFLYFTCDKWTGRLLRVICFALHV